jgi:hypothetical protein
VALRFLVANSLTGKLVGRFAPSAWDWTDPVTGQASGSLTVPLSADADDIATLRDLTQPLIRQVVAVDDDRRVWFGGPITATPERDGNNLVVPVADWRAWFYAAAIRPDGDTRQDYVHVTTPVEQNQAIADLATIALATTGAPHLIVDAVTPSGIDREINEPMFTYTGEAMDHISQRDTGPDWWVYMAYEIGDLTTVVGHVTVGYPERNAATNPLSMRSRNGLALRSNQGEGGNIVSITWPRGNVPPSRVFGVTQNPAPGEVWGTAEDPDLQDGLRLAWDEVYQLPDGVNTADAAYEGAVARLDANGEALGTIELSIDVDSTDLGDWGAGDRTRLVIDDGWQSIDSDDRRILSRTLSGKGGAVSECTITVNLSSAERDLAEDPPEETDDVGGDL